MYNLKCIFSPVNRIKFKTKDLLGNEAQLLFILIIFSQTFNQFDSYNTRIFYTAVIKFSSKKEKIWY